MKFRLHHLTNGPAKNFYIVILTALTFLFPNLAKAQTRPDLSTAANYVFFTSVGAFTNNGLTEVVGSIGTGVGELTGFPPGVVTGEIHVEDATAVEVGSKVCAAYDEILTRPCTGPPLAPALANQTLTPGVYCSPAATSLDGNMIFDAQNVADALFIVKITGTFIVGSNSNIILLNGAESKNIFFISSGAFTVGEYSTINGTVITKAGAITLGESTVVNGRALACGGAIILNNNTGTVEQVVLPIILSEFTATKQNNTTVVTWTTMSEINTKHFIVEHSTTGQANTWSSKGQITASGYSATARHYTMTDNNPSLKDNYYRLRSVDNDNSFSLSQQKHVYFDQTAAQAARVFPNPFNDVINVTGVEKGTIITVSDLSGKIVSTQKSSGASTEKINSRSLSTGTYFLRLISAQGVTTTIKMNKK